MNVDDGTAGRHAAPMLNLNDARVFVQVVAHGGFAPAARALHVPKSTLSKRVAELEQALGVVLIQRTTRRFQITPTGSDFHRHARAMVELAEAAEHEVRGRTAEPSGPVALTCSLPTAQGWLAELLPKIARKHPKLRIALHATDRFVDIVRDGFDIAVRDHFEPLPDSSLVQRKVAIDEMILVASTRYLRGHGVPRAPADLSTHEVLVTHADVQTWTLHGADQEAVTVPVRSRFAADETIALLAATQASLGIAALPASACSSHFASRSLRQVLPGWTAGRVKTTLLMPERRAQLPSVRAVADAIAEGAPRARRRAIAGE